MVAWAAAAAPAAGAGAPEAAAAVTATDDGAVITARGLALPLLLRELRAESAVERGDATAWWYDGGPVGGWTE